MSTKRGSTLRAQWLGKRLRELREAAGMTLQRAAEHIQRDIGSLSRIENGLIAARAADVLALLNLYGVTDETLRQGLERLARDARNKGWWDGYDAKAMGGMIDHAWIEARADEIRSYDVMAVPGLLQTHEYARSTIKSADPDARPETIDHWVDFRMRRQQILTQEKPVQVTAILDEAVLRRMIGGADIMHAQLRKLADLAAHPSITIHVLPFHANTCVSVQGPFTIFTMPDPFPDVAYVETRGGDVYVEEPRAEKFAQAYNYLRKAALAPEESAALISVMAEQIR